MKGDKICPSTTVVSLRTRQIKNFNWQMIIVNAPTRTNLQWTINFNLSNYITCKGGKFLKNLIRSDEGLTLETSASESLYGGQFTLSTQWACTQAVGGIRELTLEATKIEQMLKYRKASFPKSVSTSFVAHCLEAIYANCGDFLFISKL